MYFIRYAERFKGYSFYCPSHSICIVESRNAKFLENGFISGRDNRWSEQSNVDHLETQTSTSNNGLNVVVHNILRAQVLGEQLIQLNSQIDDHDIVDLVAPQILETVEQLVEQQTPQENVDATLRR